MRSCGFKSRPGYHLVLKAAFGCFLCFSGKGREEWTIYAIASQRRNYIYVGLTFNLEARLERHNRRFEKTTKPCGPVYRQVDSSPAPGTI
ncbi:MAG: GIY-YIG nuclease family protein [Cryomorphaceae bacterium]